MLLEEWLDEVVAGLVRGLPGRGRPALLGHGGLGHGVGQLRQHQDVAHGRGRRGAEAAEDRARGAVPQSGGAGELREDLHLAHLGALLRDETQGAGCHGGLQRPGLRAHQASCRDGHRLGPGLAPAVFAGFFLGELHREG